MPENKFHKIIDEIVSHEKRYDREAYKFVNAAVKYTNAKSGEKGHVGANELLAGVSEFALKEYSIFYEDIFKSWGINSASDIGNIVFSLINRKVLGAGPEDSIEDFKTDFNLFEPARKTKSTHQEGNIKVPKID